MARRHARSGHGGSPTLAQFGGPPASSEQDGDCVGDEERGECQECVDGDLGLSASETVKDHLNRGVEHLEAARYVSTGATRAAGDATRALSKGQPLEVPGGTRLV